MKDNTVVIYVGAQEIVAMLGFLGEEPHIETAVAIQRPAGFSKGLVTHLEAASDSLEALLEALKEAVTRKGRRWIEPEGVYGVLGSGKIKTFSYSSAHYYKGFTKTIAPHDVKSVMEQTKSVANLPLSEAILQWIPVSFLVNDLDGIQDPIGLEAQRLGVSLKIFTMPFEEFRNIAKAFELAELRVFGFFPRVLTVSEAVLSEKEKKDGVALIDVGRNATSCALWQKGELIKTLSLPLGLQDLIEKVSAEWQISEEDAGKVIEEYASFNLPEKFGDELIPLIVRGQEEKCPIRRAEFIGKLQEFAGVWLERMGEAVDRFSKEERVYHPRYVWCGEANTFDGFLEFIQKRFPDENIAGQIRRVDAPPEMIHAPLYAPLLGMFCWLAYKEEDRLKLTRSRNLAEKIVAGAKNLIANYF
ncbi:MAG: hypothetical protein ACOY3K_01315 [Candidatus Omnitrophota bacterium]